MVTLKRCILTGACLVLSNERLWMELNESIDLYFRNERLEAEIKAGKEEAKERAGRR